MDASIHFDSRTENLSLLSLRSLATFPFLSLTSNIVFIGLTTAHLIIAAAASDSAPLEHVPRSSSSMSSCSRACGKVPIPYPFWIDGQPSCGLPEYQIACSASGVPFFQTDSGSYPVLNITSGKLIINSTNIKASIASYSFSPSVLNITSGKLIINSTNIKASIASYSFSPAVVHFDLTSKKGLFVFSGLNVFVALGCGSVGSCNGSYGSQSIDTFKFSCEVPCGSTSLFPFCRGAGCCLASVPSGLTRLHISTRSSEIVIPYQLSQIYSTVLQPNDFGNGHFSLGIAWGIIVSESVLYGDVSCYPACAEQAKCTSEILGLYFCNCTEGYSGDGYKNGSGCSLSPPPPPPETPPPSSSSITQIILAVLSTGIITSVLGVGLFWLHISQQVRRRKAKYLEMHGGRRFQELWPASIAMPKLFSEKELQKATLNFSEDMKLGAGGFGTVYKGNLQDASVVAIKKSHCMQLQPGEVDNFLNEILLLSNVNHRNIVRFLGCCLEAQVPLLVFEYIPNGTLSDHLHGKICTTSLTWALRLNIARQTADALAYLHCAASKPIIHRDVKSSNILLDGNFKPKVADFGLSRLLAPDQTHVSTAVLGTFGYLDPEYFNTFQLTDKSDVYSFGVVLLELITSLSPASMGGNLPSLCTSRLRRGEFSKLIDSRLNVSTGSQDMICISHVAELAMSCLADGGRDRPSMREVSDKLHHMQSASLIHEEPKASCDQPEPDLGSAREREGRDLVVEINPFQHYNRKHLVTM